MFFFNLSIYLYFGNSCHWFFLGNLLEWGLFLPHGGRFYGFGLGETKPNWYDRGASFPNREGRRGVPI